MADEAEVVQHSPSTPTHNEPPNAASGRVRWFNAMRGFGYIVRDNGSSVFVRRSAIAKPNPLKRCASLENGEKVQFILTEGDRGLEARSVTGPDGAYVIGSTHTPERKGQTGRRKRRKKATSNSAFGACAKTPSSEALSQEPQSLESSQAVGIPASMSSETVSSVSLPLSRLPVEEDLTLFALEEHSGSVVRRRLASDSWTEALTPLAQFSPFRRKLEREGSKTPTILKKHPLTAAQRKPPKMKVPLHMVKYKAQKQRSVRELSRSEEASLLGSNKYVRCLLSSPNVVSLSYTNEVRKGRPTGRKVLQVGVIKKLNRREIKRQDVRVHGRVLLGQDLAVPVQVVEEGELNLLKACNGGAQLRVSRDKMKVNGTLGARDKEGHRYRILSCAHVLTGFKEENIGAPIAVASGPEEEFEDLGWRVGGQANIHWSWLRKRWHMKQDLAWAYVECGEVSSSITKIGQIRGKRKPKVGREVKIYGGWSGTFVEGKKIANTNASISYKRDGVNFTHLCYIEGTYGFDHGDSGSAVVDEETNELVGIFMGTSGIRTYFTAVLLDR